MNTPRGGCRVCSVVLCCTTHRQHHLNCNRSLSTLLLVTNQQHVNACHVRVARGLTHDLAQQASGHFHSLVHDAVGIAIAPTYLASRLGEPKLVNVQLACIIGCTNCLVHSNRMQHTSIGCSYNELHNLSTRKQSILGNTTKKSQGALFASSSYAYKLADAELRYTLSNCCAAECTALVRPCAPTWSATVASCFNRDESGT